MRDAVMYTRDKPLLWEREPTVLPAVPAGEPYGIAFWALIKDEFAKRFFSANHTTDKKVSPVVFDCVRVEHVVFWVCWHSCPFCLFRDLFPMRPV